MKSLWRAPFDWRPILRSSANLKVKIGTMPGYGGSQRLARLVGKGRALQIILSGQIIGA